ncbi:hypothetical protein VRU48_11270 [Pedobacter sp. KR3-3]|uniref:DUF3575 domain-containing protein n=1 Tax=Pedobacter albus TaxID=3113905 RepID=A0ABU7I893_9SPHI|nr:hypothetical protein [Pedobacter sp. KR3-3]MEE1945688.1 hypothetical protein [Pedobacter sp. KR3-3]
MTFKNAFKTFVILLTTIISLNKASAQDTVRADQPAAVKSLNKIRLNLLGLYYEHEQKIGMRATVYFGAGLASTVAIEYGSRFEQSYNGTSYDYTISRPETRSYFSLSPSVYAGIRNYYNFNKRIAKGKRTINNSGSYFGAEVAGYFYPLFQSKGYTSPNWEIGLTPVWGFQHAMSRKTSFEFNIGPTVRTNEFETYYGIDGRIGFTFLL